MAFCAMHRTFGWKKGIKKLGKSTHPRVLRMFQAVDHNRILPERMFKWAAARLVFAVPPHLRMSMDELTKRVQVAPSVYRYSSERDACQFLGKDTPDGVAALHVTYYNHVKLSARVDDTPQEPRVLVAHVDARIALLLQAMHDMLRAPGHLYTLTAQWIVEHKEDVETYTRDKQGLVQPAEAFYSLFAEKALLPDSPLAYGRDQFNAALGIVEFMITH